MSTPPADVAADPSGMLAVAYEDSSTGRLKFARRAENLVWSRQVADPSTRGVAFVSLQVDSMSRPHISYYDANPADLRYATNSGGTWATTTLASRGPVGLFTTLAIENDLPSILYYDRRTDSLNKVAYSDGTWSTTRIRDRGGRFLSCNMSPDGLVCAFIASDSLQGNKLTLGEIETMIV
jgi:hypothetical protein